ncbi:MAG TPA: hypothetical protein VGF55_29215 [Gemmataceae bacterium]|jgi:hypothetical protein
MVEPKYAPLPPRRVFFRRFVRSFLIGQAMVAGSLMVGMAGYRYFEGMSWVDAFANAAMILSGMGPLEPLRTAGGKLFAGCYALYSGLALIVIVGIVFGPVVHRFLHRFHLESRRERD